MFIINFLAITVHANCLVLVSNIKVPSKFKNFTQYKTGIKVKLLSHTESHVQCGHTFQSNSNSNN